MSMFRKAIEQAEKAASEAAAQANMSERRARIILHS